MNIFVLNLIPRMAAEAHCDKHVVKMILETAQLLYSAHHVAGGPLPDGAYKKTHVNHPCAIWVRESAANYRWLCELGFWLCKEYQYRYGEDKVHKTERHILWLRENLPIGIPDLVRTPFPQAMPVEYKCEDPVEAYHTYYRENKVAVRNIVKYTRRQVPEFLVEKSTQPIYMTAAGKEYTNALEMSSTTSAVKSNTKMPADKKTATKAAAPAPAPAPAPAAPSKKAAKTAAPAATKKETASKAEVVIPTVATPAVAPATATQSSEVLLASLTEQLKALSTEFTTKVREAVKATQEAAKAAKKEARDSKKKRKVSPEQMTPEQRAAWEARRANNAFLVERPLSDELCHFMGISAGSKRSQTQVTKYVSEYVKSHNCFDPSFKRRIIPNAALAKLLRVDDKTEVTYLNLQKYLKVHFKKA